MITKPKQAIIVAFYASYFTLAKHLTPLRKCADGMYYLQETYNVYFPDGGIQRATYRRPKLFIEDALKPLDETFAQAQEVMVQGRKIIGTAIKTK